MIVTSQPIPVVECIEIFSWWVGFADPPARAAKLTITRSGGRFLRAQALAGPPEELPAEAIGQLLAALSRDPVAQLEPALFDVSEAALRAHYDSLWTDDSPGHLVRVTLAPGRVVTVRAETQQAFMLPLKVIDSAGIESETYDPRLSRALAALMPDGYPDKERLAGRLGQLEWAAEEATHVVDQPAEVPSAPADKDPKRAEDVQSGFEEILRILHGEESPEERDEAERAGQLSERLLRRNSLGEVQDLLARGANPSIADEHGQTALMLAASPPVDRDRFRLLVRSGADVEARRYDGCTGLHLACAGGMAEATEEWVKAGANIHALTPEGATPLMLGATWLDIVRFLLAAGADVNASDLDGHTALVYAILGQSWITAEQTLEAMRALLAAETDVNRRDQGGVAPLGHARRVLARAQLHEEVCRAFHPDVDPSLGLEWDERRMAEAVCNLIASAGGRD